MRHVHSLVVGSGAAGLNAAVQLRQLGIDDLLIVSEGADRGTSINTGSDKQTYYKLGLCGAEGDSPVELARTLFAGGAMHGDHALVEAALSARAFLHLVDLGVPFPRDAYGQFVGYKTDHDPRRRATSIGPYTSREMCRALIRRVRELGIPWIERVNGVELLTVPTPDGGSRAAGVVLVTADGGFEAVTAENVVFAVGGPGGLYATSVYPAVHTGAIGLALLAGAAAQNLPESQYGMASIRFRWNVSGTYMQVVPRFVSTGPDGTSDAREFLAEAVNDPGALHSLIFLKGYQWPFDVRKVRDGSSLLDVLVYLETVRRGRRVFLDYRTNPSGYDRRSLSSEARDYLDRSGASQATPYERLLHMNPGAVQLYREHGIDLASAPLEIAVCAQHNNGGLAATAWWESTTLGHLFPVGEVCGTHGVTRPGGSALNSGQVGGFRVAEYIANCYRGATLDEAAAVQAAERSLTFWRQWAARGRESPRSWREERQALQARMSREGAHIRNAVGVAQAIAETDAQWQRLDTAACGWDSPQALVEACRNRQLCAAARAYLAGIAEALRAGIGSRGSAMVLDPTGEPAHALLGEAWRLRAEDGSFREEVQLTLLRPDGTFEHAWEPRRPIPDDDPWFETAWADFRSGAIYGAGCTCNERPTSNA